MADEMTPLELVRVNITDLDSQKYLFTDQQLLAWLQLHNGSVLRTSAQALRTIAVSELLMGKVIRTQDLQTSSDRLARELNAIADRYEDQADKQEEDEDESSSLAILSFGSNRRGAEGEEARW